MSRVARTRIVVLLMPLAVAYGCALDWTVPKAGASDASVGAPVEASIVSDGGILRPDPAQPGDSSLPPGQCRTNADCLEDSLCTFANFDCGKGSSAGLGACAPRKVSDMDPSLCAGGGGRVCGCDGLLYENVCAMLSIGVDLSTSACDQTASKDGRVGYAFCLPSSYAIEDPSRPRTSRYRCEPLTNPCDAGDCACLLLQFCPQSGQNPQGGRCEGNVVSCP